MLYKNNELQMLRAKDIDTLHSTQVASFITQFPITSLYLKKCFAFFFLIYKKNFNNQST